MSMNPDNPYAAPQTVDSQFDLSALPIAELQQLGGKRRRFPDHSTAQLQRLFDKSQPLEAMLLVWLALWFVTVAFLVALFLRTTALSDSHKWLGWTLFEMITARLLCNFMRTKLGRWYMLLGDAALICACLALVLTALPDFVYFRSFWVYCVEALISLTIAVLAFRSCQTLLLAHELFHPNCVQHDDLMRELSYRKEQRID
jgi:hypothetical protein